MEDRETAQMRKYGESKTTRIMMATVPHVTSDLGLRKFQADGFLLTRMYNTEYGSVSISLYSQLYIIPVNPGHCFHIASVLHHSPDSHMHYTTVLPSLRKKNTL